MDPTIAAQMFVPITRIDKDKWEIEGQATSDVVDYYETIFDYESSKKAFGRWAGNIREMHKNEAVGHAIQWEPDDTNRSITVRAFVSKGSPNTWAKICDGTLRGFSIGLPKDKYKTRMVERNGKSILEYYDHELAEVSIVDNPGSPGCDIAIVRMNGDNMEITDVLDNTEETTPITPEAPPEIERAGARVSHVTQDALHGMRNNHLQNAQSTMKLCGCDECMSGCSALDPDDDGDIDIIVSLDMDNDGGKSDMSAGYGMRELEPVIMRALAPTIQRLNASLAQMAMNNNTKPLEPQIMTIDTTAIERRLIELEKLGTGIAEVRSLLSEVKELAEKSQEIIERVEKQPVPGGPIASTQAMDKILATQGYASSAQLNDAQVIQRASQMGLLTDQSSQVVGAALQIKQMFGQQ